MIAKPPERQPSVTTTSGRDPAIDAFVANMASSRARHFMILQMDEFAHDMVDIVPPDEAAKYKSCQDVRLQEVFENPEWRQAGVRIKYEYDTGDGWEHRIDFLGPAEPHLATALELEENPGVFCFGGEGHPCCEDYGGFGGWEDLKDFFKQPLEADPGGRREWYKKRAANGDRKGLDPWKWNIVEVNKDLAKLRF